MHGSMNVKSCDTQRYKKTEVRFGKGKKEQPIQMFNIHGTVHRSMTSSNNQRDAA